MRWGSATTLVRFVKRNAAHIGGSASEEAPLSGTRILELGSGTGAVGLVLAALGADVLLTDTVEHIPLLQHNIRINQESGVIRSHVEALVLDWREALPKWAEHPDKPFDAVVASDITYEPMLYDDLLRTLDNFPSVPVFLAHERRKSGERRFFERLRAAGWKYDIIPPVFLSPEDRDAGAIVIFCLRKGARRVS